MHTHHPTLFIESFGALRMMATIAHGAFGVGQPVPGRATAALPAEYEKKRCGLMTRLLATAAARVTVPRDLKPGDGPSRGREGEGAVRAQADDGAAARRNRRFGTIRAKVEHVFRVMKCKFIGGVRRWRPPRGQFPSELFQTRECSSLGALAHLIREAGRVSGQTCGVLRVDGGGFENLLERVGV